MVTAIAAALAPAALLLWAMHRRWRKWPRQWRDKYSCLGKVKAIPTRPDRRMLEDR